MNNSALMVGRTIQGNYYANPIDLLDYIADRHGYRGPKSLWKAKTWEDYDNFVAEELINPSNDNFSNVNIILMTDSYKASQYNQYPAHSRFVYSYIESRGGKWDKAVMFGLQMFIKKYLLKRITRADIEEASEFWALHGEPFNREGWEYILKKHKGKLPLRIKAVPEGTVVDGKNILASIVNTDPECYWLTSYVETPILRAVWYGTTVATNSYVSKQRIYAALVKSSDDPDGQLPFKLHDFGARGVSSHESAEIGGAAHLINFMGSDNVEGVLAAKRFYGEMMAGFSVAAMEHSTVTSWGRFGEVESYRNMIRQYAKPGKIFACVSDSYDLFYAIDHIWGGTLKQEVIDSGATLVVRPDSGDPATIPVEAVIRLGAKFGYTVNSKGFKVLATRANGIPIVRVLQGDGINEEMIGVILDNLLAAGWSADNIVFGQGGALLQQLDRDTMKFAMKCSAIDIDGVWHDVFKDPATDHGKRSKRGLLALVANDNGFETVPLVGNEDRDCLIEIYFDGALVNETTLAEIRERSNIRRIAEYKIAA